MKDIHEHDHNHGEECCGHNHDHKDGECCGHDHEEELETLNLSLDDGTELECAVLGVFEVEEVEYIALYPLDADEEDEGILLYEFTEIDEESVQLDVIEDESTFDKVAAAFDELYQEEE